PIEPARELVVVIRGIGEEIGRLPVRPHDHAVLLIAEGGRAKPEGAVPLLDQPPLRKPGAGLFDRAAAMELAFPKPPIDARAEAGELPLLTFQHPVDAPSGEPQALLALRMRQPLASLGFRDRVGDLGHIAPRVALFGDRRSLDADPLREARPDRSNAPATSRGGRRAVFARVSATGVAQSPCSGSRGTSTSTRAPSGIEKPARAIAPSKRSAR